jgi:sugar phosphate isomerase/epimerase
VLDAAAEAGFRHVGVDHLSVDGRAPEQVAAMLRERGLACTDVGVLRLGLDEPRTAARRLAALATATGARTCVAAVFDGTQEDARGDLAEAASILAAAGVRVALEHAAYGGLRTLADAAELCASVGWERCGLLVDAWHVLHGGEDVSSLRAAEIELVHVSDAPAAVGPDLVYESRFRRVPPGLGRLALEGFMSSLREIGYDGVVSLEVLSSELRARPPAAAAHDLRRAVRSIS